MPTGIVQFFLESKGYGYVRVPETREEFHFRRKALRTPVKKGDQVRFRLVENRHGLFAVDLEKVKETDAD